MSKSSFFPGNSLKQSCPDIDDYSNHQAEFIVYPHFYSAVIKHWEYSRENMTAEMYSDALPTDAETVFKFLTLLFLNVIKNVIP